MRHSDKKKVAVIGAGIAGLSAAHYIRKRGVDVSVFEREGVAGGSVRSSMRDDKYLIELGPNAFLASAEPLQRLARELSIDPLVVGSDELSKNRYIYRGKKMHRLPAGPVSFMRSGIMSFGGKIRMMAEPFVRSRSPGLETLAGFVRRRVGKEVLAALVDPFVSGVWAGDAEELEVESCFPRLVEVERECGSVFRGMKKLAGGVRKRGLYSFRWGMGTITARLEEELKGSLSLGAAVEEVVRKPDGRWRLKFSGSRGPFDCDAVVAAVPSYAAAKLLIKTDPEMFSPLQAIPYASLAVVHTAFRASDLAGKTNGFGVLIPRSEGIRMLGSIWSSSIFPGRCPRGEALLTNFIGGATDPGLVDLSDDEILNEVLSGLRFTMGISNPPSFSSVKRWGQAIPQYTVGHKARVEEIFSREENLPGVFLTGAWIDGISVSDTIANARATVDRVAAYLK